MTDFYLYLTVLERIAWLLVPAAAGLLLHHLRGEIESPSTRQVFYLGFVALGWLGAAWGAIQALTLAAIGFWNLFLVPALLAIAARGGWTLFRRLDPRSPSWRTSVLFLYATAALALIAVLCFLVVQATGQGLDGAPPVPRRWVPFVR